VRKGGALENTRGRKCICNGLASTVGLRQALGNGETELPLVTAGDDFAQVAEFLPPGADSYTAGDVIRRLLAST
jgi:hypothetical protein